MTISTTKNTWESICDLFSSIEIKESSIEIKESSIEIKRSFSIHLETVVPHTHLNDLLPKICDVIAHLYVFLQYYIFNA